MPKSWTVVHYFSTILLLQLFGTAIGGENVVFPRGHMQPLGGHRDPDPVEERSVDQMPTPLEFWNEFLVHSKAVVFRGAAKKFPGASLWTDSYLKEKYGDLEMRLEGKKEKDARMGRYPEGDLGIGRDTMRNFINTYRGSLKYIVSELPSPMYHEAGVLPFMGCSPLRDSIVEVDIWMNGNNASSIMHKDAFNQLNCLYNGTKVWKLISFEHEDKVYKRYEPEGNIGGFSMINVSAVDLLRYPKIAEVPWQQTVLNAGDCLYLPGSMYHQVQSSGTHNLAVSLLFRRLQFEENKDVDFGKCANESLEFETLDKFEPDWAYNGTGMMSMGNTGFDFYRQVILSLYSSKTSKLSRRRIAKVLVNKETVKKDKAKEYSKIVYDKVVRLFGTNKLPTEDMLSSKSMVREIALEFEPVEASNYYNFEYALTEPDDILKLLRIGIKKGNGKGSRKDFIKHYIDNLLGTERFAEKFMNTLMEDDAEYFTMKHIKKNIKKALKPYFAEHHRGKPFDDPEPNYDAGDIEKAQRQEHERRMKAINEADDPSVFDESFFEDLVKDLLGNGDDNKEDARNDDQGQFSQDEKHDDHAEPPPEHLQQHEDYSSTDATYDTPTKKDEL